MITKKVKNKKLIKYLIILYKLYKLFLLSLYYKKFFSYINESNIFI